MKIPSEKQIFNNIQALRGIAALLVCAFHYRFLINQSWSEFLFSNGWIGVQIFFIISGFIMVNTTSRIKTDFTSAAKKFFLNRLIRIAPLYYICTFIFIADDLNDGYLVQNGSRLLHSLLFIYPESTLTTLPSLEVGWSLNYEMMFYLVFTVAILFGIRKIPFLYTYFIATVFLIPVLLIGKISDDYKTYLDYPVSYLNVISNPILLHFLLGISLALIIPKLKLSRTFCIAMLILSSLFFIAYLTKITGLPINLWNDLLICGFLVFSVLINDYHKRGMRFPSFMIRLGDMSYSFYLLHPIVLGYIPLLQMKMMFLQHLHGSALFFFTISLTILCSMIFYQTIEIRLTNYLRHKFNP